MDLLKKIPLRVIKGNQINSIINFSEEISFVLIQNLIEFIRFIEYSTVNTFIADFL